MDIVEEQVAGLLRLSEERRVLLDEQDRRMQSLNDELANRQSIIDDCRRRLASQAQALKEAAITSSKLEERLDDEWHEDCRNHCHCCGGEDAQFPTHKMRHASRALGRNCVIDEIRHLDHF